MLVAGNNSVVARVWYNLHAKDMNQLKEWNNRKKKVGVVSNRIRKDQKYEFMSCLNKIIKHQKYGIVLLTLYWSK